MRLQQPEPIRRSTAYHESGHVIAHLSFKMPFYSVTIKPDLYGEYNGRVFARSSQSKTEHLLIMYLAGAFAEKRGCNNASCTIAEGAHRDHILVDDLITRMPHVSNKEGWRIFENATLEFVHKHWQPIDVIGGALLILETINYDDIIDILSAQCPDFVLGNSL